MTQLETELAAIGLLVTRAEAVALAQLTTAAEFETALVDIGLVETRNRAHQILLALKRARQTKRDACRPVRRRGPSSRHA